MKKIYLLLSLSSIVFTGNILFAQAQYSYDNYQMDTPYYNNYVQAPTSNSYTYRVGCYIYQYDAYTRITSLIGSSCTTNTYTYPTYQTYYTQPSYQTYYTQPTYIYTYTLPTYQYTYNPGYYHGRKFHHTYGYNNTQNYSYNCTWQNGYQICY